MGLTGGGSLRNHQITCTNNGTTLQPTDFPRTPTKVPKPVSPPSPSESNSETECSVCIIPGCKMKFVQSKTTDRERAFRVHFNAAHDVEERSNQIGVEASIHIFTSLNSALCEHCSQLMRIKQGGAITNHNTCTKAKTTENWGISEEVRSKASITPLNSPGTRISQTDFFLQTMTASPHEQQINPAPNTVMSTPPTYQKPLGRSNSHPLPTFHTTARGLGSTFSAANMRDYAKPQSFQPQSPIPNSPDKGTEATLLDLGDKQGSKRKHTCTCDPTAQPISKKTNEKTVGKQDDNTSEVRHTSPAQTSSKRVTLNLTQNPDHTIPTMCKPMLYPSTQLLKQIYQQTNAATTDTNNVSPRHIPILDRDHEATSENEAFETPNLPRLTEDELRQDTLLFPLTIPYHMPATTIGNIHNATSLPHPEPTPPPADPVWLVLPWQHAVFQIIDQNAEFFEKAIPHHIPKFLHTIPTEDPSLLAMFADIVVSIVETIRSAPSEEHATLPWILFFWLPHLLLDYDTEPTGKMPHDFPSSPNAQQANQLRTKMEQLASDPASLFHKIVTAPKEKPKPDHNESLDSTQMKYDPRFFTKLQQKGVMKAFAKGQFSKAMSIVRGDSLPKSPVQTEDDLRELCQKYFHEYPKNTLPILQILSPRLQRWPNGAPEIISAEDLEKGVKQLGNTAGGISGWSASILKQLIGLNPPIKETVLFIVRQIAGNKLPTAISKFITAILLTLLLKPNASIRPISVGEIFMRLTGSILIGRITETIKRMAWPIQLGLCTKGSCEVANTINKLVYELLPILRTMPNAPPRLKKFSENGHVFSLFMDLTNCYGRISLDVFAKILNQYPEIQTLGPYFTLQYGSQSHMMFSFSKARELLLAMGVAENGFFQGEVLAGLGSCLVLLHVIKQALVGFKNTELKLLIIAAIIDDTTIHAPAETLVKFITNFNKEIRELHTGEINTSKTFLLPPTDVESCPPLADYTALAIKLTTIINGRAPTADDPDLIKVKTEGEKSLGIPHGTDAFKVAYLQGIAREVTDTLQRLSQLQHKQMQYHLVKICISGIPTSILRQVPPSLTIPHLVEPIQEATLKWLHLLLANSIAEPHPPINQTSIMIAATRCSEGGAGLPLQHQQIAPYAFFTATIAACATIREVYSQEGPSDNIILTLVDELLQLHDPNDTDWYLLPRYPARADLLKTLAEYVKLKNMHTGTTLQDLSTRVPIINQAMASTALSVKNKEFINSRLTNDLDKAQFLSQQAPGAACALVAPPTIPAFTFTSEEFAALLNTRLFSRQPDPIGFPMPSQYQQLDGHKFEDVFRCCFCKHQGATLSYEHILVCPGGGGNIKRHDECAYIFMQLLKAAGIYNVIREPKPVSGGTQKKADILAYFQFCLKRAYDWAVISPNVPTYAAQAATLQLYAACTKFDDKNKKHGPAHFKVHIDFVAMIMESTGAFHGRALREIEALVTMAGSNACPTHNAPNITDAFQYWVHVISIAAVRATMRKLVTARTAARRNISRHLQQITPSKSMTT